MSETDSRIDFESAPIREEYSEHETEDGCIAVINDPENELAWIKSNVSADVEA